MNSQKIWANLCNMKYKGFILELLVAKYQDLDQKINIFLAIASSGSIAAWLIWDKFPLVWGAIIAVSQAITAVKPYLPYSKMVKDLNSKCLSISLLNNEYERFYSKVRRKKLTEDVVEQMYFDYNKSYLPILGASDDFNYKTSNAIKDEANEKMNIFLKTYYNIVTEQPKNTQNGTKRKSRISAPKQR